MIHVISFLKQNYLVLSLLFITLLLNIKNKKRRACWIIWGAFSAAMLVISVFLMKGWVWTGDTLQLSSMLLDEPLRILIYVLLIFQMTLSFEIDVWTSFFLFLIAYAVQSLIFGVSMIVVNVMNLLLHNTVSDAWTIIIEYGIGILSFILFFILFFCKIKNTRLRTENHFALVLTSGIFLVMEFINIYIYAFDPYAHHGGTMNALRLMNFLLILVSTYLLYNIIDRVDLKIEKDMLEALSRQKIRQYVFSQELINSINIKSHDLKKQLNYLKSHESERTELYDELEKTISSYDSVIRTENETLSTILSEKSMICNGYKIPFSCIADGRGVDFIKPIDLYTLMANLMDNAIEASLKLDESRRSIEVIIKQNKGFLSIHVENYCSGKVTIEDNIALTTKRDKDYHGFGTRSIKQIVDKYNGTLTLKQVDGRFIVNILIPLPEDRES